MEHGMQRHREKIPISKGERPGTDPTLSVQKETTQLTL